MHWCGGPIQWHIPVLLLGTQLLAHLVTPSAGPGVTPRGQQALTGLKDLNLPAEL